MPARKPRAEPDIEFVLHPEHDADYVHFQDSAANPFVASAPAPGRCNAWWMAEAALLSYWRPDVALPRFAAAGLATQFLEEHDVECYLSATPEFVLVAFRGTQPDRWRDILHDAEFVMAPWIRPGMLVHKGFARALNNIWPELEAKLRTLAATRSVWFAGHSLGAALATLAADRFELQSCVCTIGSPRVGDRAFAQAFDARFGARSLRYVNDADLVTHVPPRQPLPYCHVQQLRHIDAGGAISGGVPALAHFFDDVFGDPLQVLELVEALRDGKLLRAPDALLDHMPRAYSVDIWNDYADHGD